MKRTLINLAALAAFMAASACCNRPDAAAAPSALIDQSLGADSVAAAMTARLSPAESAALLVDWLADAPLDSRDFAARLTRRLIEGYGSEGGQAFSRAADSLAIAADPQRRARIFAAASSPEQLAASIGELPSPDETARLIAQAYEADSALYSRFMRALDKTPLSKAQPIDSLPTSAGHKAGSSPEITPN